MKKCNRILVTGGAGFIGSHLVEHLAGCGLSVIVADNLYTGKLSNLKSSLETGLVEFVKCDIRFPSRLQNAVKSADAIVHLAAISSASLASDQPVLATATNVEGTANVLSLCVRMGVKKLVFVSSASVYGEPSRLPIVEDQPLNPMSLYAQSKKRGEDLCRESSGKSDLKTIIIRPFNAYGTRETPGRYCSVVTKWVDRINQKLPLVVYGDGSQTRDMVHVSDVAEAIRLALASDVEEKVLNVGSGKPTTMNELARKLIDASGSDVEIVHEAPKPNEITRSVADISKARTLLGYEPRINLDDGLKALIDDFAIEA